MFILKITDLYIGFEPETNGNDLYYITHYSLTKTKHSQLIKNMEDVNWDGNIGKTREELRKQRKDVARNIEANKLRQQTSKHFTDYFPTIAPEHRLSNEQIQNVKELIRKYKEGEVLNPKEIKILTRFYFLNEGWQNYLDRVNMNIDNPIRNLWHDNKVDPSEAPSIYEQIDEIVGPTLSDID